MFWTKDELSGNLEKNKGIQSFLTLCEPTRLPLPYPTPRGLPDPGIKPMSPEFPVCLLALTDGFFTTMLPGKPLVTLRKELNF